MMAAIPLVLFNLLAGLASLPDVRILGRVGGRILLYYGLTNVLAVVLGLAVTDLLRPGAAIQLAGEAEGNVGEAPPISVVLVELVPDNVFQALSAGRVSQVVVFAVLLGVTTLLLPQEKREALQSAFDLLAELLRKLVDLIMRFGPIGIGALAAATVGQYGSAIFGPLAVFIAGVWGAQAGMAAVHLVLLFGLSRRSPIRFLKQTAPLYATTAATCSSLASLAVALEVAEERVKLPRSIYAFTLPLGAQIMKNGTAVMAAGVLLLTAQAAGVDFDPISFLTIVLIGALLSAGSGGIPGGGMVMAFLFVQTFNLPLKIAGVVSGIYRLLDIGNTTLNGLGNMAGTTIVADLEKRRGRVETGA